MSGKRAKKLRKIAKSMTGDMPDCNYSQNGKPVEFINTGYDQFRVPGESRKLNPMTKRGYTQRLKRRNMTMEQMVAIIGSEE